MDARKRFHDQIMQLLENKTDSERSKLILLHDEWRVGRECSKDEVLRHGKDLYRCLQPHTAQADWPPPTTTSLFVKVMYRDGIRIIPKIITATEAFKMDELGWEGDTLYRSKRDGNTFPPSVTPEWWEAIEE